MDELSRPQEEPSEQHFRSLPPMKQGSGTDLPAHIEPRLDPQSGLYYYYNSETLQSGRSSRAPYRCMWLE